MCMQKEMNQLQSKASHIQMELAQWDTKLDGRLKEFKEKVKGEIKLELQTLFEQYLGQP